MCDYCDYPVTDRRNPDYGKRKATPEAETGGELDKYNKFEFVSELLDRYEQDKSKNTSKSLEVQEGVYEDFIWSEVQNLENLIAAHTRRAVLLGKLEELRETRTSLAAFVRGTAKDPASNELLELADRIKALEAELKEIK